MFCKNCGNELEKGAAFCPKCGYQKGSGSTFCANCGNELAPGAHVCGKCGYQFEQANAQQSTEPKSKIAAGLLGILLAGLGIHNFYLGYTGKAVAQLILTLVGWVACGIGPLVSVIWCLVEGIQILCGTINKDAKGVPLKE